MNKKIRHLTFLPLIVILLFFSSSSVIYAQKDGTTLRLIVTDSMGQIKRGTGFVASGYNYIITAYHVIQNARKIDIDRPQSLLAHNLKIVGIYPNFDIALLQIPLELKSSLIPFKVKKKATPSSSSRIIVMGYGSVIDRPENYHGYHENAPFVLSELWLRPANMPGNSTRLFNASGVRLLKLQAPLPYGLSGGPVVNQDGEVVGVVSGALTRLENITSLGWAIPIDYALKRILLSKGKRAAEMDWPALKLITDKKLYLRAFGGPVVNLIAKLRCPESIKLIESAWDTATYAITRFQGYLTSARVAVDIGARKASSRAEARMFIKGQMSLLNERFAEVRKDAEAYRRQIVIAVNSCNRDTDAIEEAIGILPKTKHNRLLKQGVTKLIRGIARKVYLQSNENNKEAEYELKKYWGRYSSIKPLSDDDSSFFSRPSNSIESDIHMFVQLVDVFESAIQSFYLGAYKEIYRDLESSLGSYLLWIESTNRQPWDRG